MFLVSPAAGHLFLGIRLFFKVVFNLGLKTSIVLRAAFLIIVSRAIVIAIVVILFRAIFIWEQGEPVPTL